MALLLERPRGALKGFSPGDVIRATGVVSQRTGLPVLAVEDIAKTGSGPPPAAVRVRVEDLTRFENIGRYVSIEASIVAPGRNAGGDLLVIEGKTSSPVTVFYPRYARWEQPGLQTFEAGDRIRVTGIAHQYCPVQPYDRGFQLVVDDPDQVMMLQRGWVIPPGTVCIWCSRSSCRRRFGGYGNDDCERSAAPSKR